ncbi:MAG: hydrolase [Archangium sp.]|nr:hydrolase [Archangium sp.]
MSAFTGEPTSSLDGAVDEQPVEVPVHHGKLGALLFLPAVCDAGVVFAHPSGIARLSRRERFVASALARAGFATLLVDLLTEDEDAVRKGAHEDLELLTERLLTAAFWLSASRRVPLGYLGVGTAAAAALVATAIEPGRARAVVSRGSRAGFADASLLTSPVPALFIVPAGPAGELAATSLLAPRRRLEIVPATTADFAEGDALDRVTALSTAWFTQWLDPRDVGVIDCSPA